jgi:hypothetical protein
MDKIKLKIFKIKIKNVTFFLLISNALLLILNNILKIKFAFSYLITNVPKGYTISVLHISLFLTFKYKKKLFT